MTKWNGLFENEKWEGLPELILKIVQKYVKDHPNVTLSEFQQVFSKEYTWYGYGIHKLDFIIEVSKYDLVNQEAKKYYNTSETIRINNKEFYVNAKWGVNKGIPMILTLTKKLGYKIKIFDSKGNEWEDNK